MLTVWPKEALTSETMMFLQSILLDWCRQNGVAVMSDVGVAKARSLIDWYEFGIKERGELFKLLSEEIGMAGPAAP
ncbi:hypothetical protein DEM27_17680 [Metarhizobium album]|uniref:Uncharacterized protein n=1 Tax=Metarhizobium album TaxID=2182425 RepID=A0A2U2DN91_9HYPH|nr:hypothetical protein [Rhizobium album]OJT98786.1 MAG: hypothetical protein BGN83_21245 [Rhizobium sp. 63-7]PWE54785.1 hypothetical protein DEM27_17680 [Rhizobium album]